MEVLRPVTALPIEPTFDSDFTEAISHPRSKDDALTDSMVTIRLSDPQFLAKAKLSTETKAIAASKNKENKPVPFPHGTAVLDSQDTVLHEDEDFALHGAINNEALQSVRSPSASTLASSAAEDSAEQGSSYLHIRTGSIDSSSSGESAHVDWEELDKNEKEKQKDECSDDSTAFLLARLERENNALAIDPKAAITKTRARSRSRPPSYQQLRKLVSEPVRSSLRYSLLPSPPPMTELEFWSALVSNYSQTAQRLPTLTSNKIRGGVPPPLRGVVWMSIAGARDPFLEDEYDRLCGESSPYEKLIGKDIGRSFPGVDMFRDPNGEGQKMLGKVLNAFSLWDQEIGYCQGLGFVVGPLLMHMGDKEAFCVLVRLMEHYDLRSCFLPDLSGLHLRIYQFQHLLSQDLPQLAKHLDDLKLEPLYLSQWFLSFFGVTCPLPMLLRIYDVILAEGASETLMRVALSLMRRNEKKILATTEFGDIMQLLVSRAMWDTYGCSADDLVTDFCGLTGLVTRDALQRLETKFKETHDDSPTSLTRKPSVHSAASRFLGRFWAGSSPSQKSSNNNSLSLSAPSRPVSYLRRTPSKQSMASTLNSVEGSDSNVSAASTDATDMSQEMSAEWVPQKPTNLTAANVVLTRATPAANNDRSLHSQIEDLLTALSDMQRDQNILVGELQREREERDEDRNVVQRFIEKMTKGSTLTAIQEDEAEPPTSEIDVSEILSEVSDSVTELKQHFMKGSGKRSSIALTKHQLHEEVVRLKEQHREEASRSAKLSRQLTEREREAAQVKDELREARSRIQESHRDKQRLEKTVQDFRSRKSAVYDSNPESPTSATSEYFSSSGGLRELRLGRPAQSPVSLSTPAFAKRSSSLSTQAVLATADHRPANEDALLLELVNAKTAEAVARQELEEVKGKLDSLRKLLGGQPTSPGAVSGHRPSPSSPALTYLPSARSPQETPKLAAPAAASGGGFFSGWGKRSTSTSGPSGAAS
ncbi:ecotropic viral integration site [Xylographa bjoerkii]|nr:ecotropic viral integration site [Xylographa bjoerkii]